MKKKRKSLLELFVTKHRRIILEGTMVSVDPATGNTSDLGWAYFEATKLKGSGTIKLPSNKSTIERLRILVQKLWDKFEEPVDILAIEKIRSSHTSLRWAVAVTFIGIDSQYTFEVHPRTWHRFVPKGYVKSDKKDAENIGWALIKLEKEMS